MSQIEVEVDGELQKNNKLKSGQADKGAGKDGASTQKKNKNKGRKHDHRKRSGLLNRKIVDGESDDSEEINVILTKPKSKLTEKVAKKGQEKIKGLKVKHQVQDSDQDSSDSEEITTTKKHKKDKKDNKSKAKEIETEKTKKKEKKAKKDESEEEEEEEEEEVQPKKKKNKENGKSKDAKVTKKNKAAVDEEDDDSDEEDDEKSASKKKSKGKEQQKTKNGSLNQKRKNLHSLDFEESDDSDEEDTQKEDSKKDKKAKGKDVKPNKDLNKKKQEEKPKAGRIEIEEDSDEEEKEEKPATKSLNDKDTNKQNQGNQNKKEKAAKNKSDQKQKTQPNAKQAQNKKVKGNPVQVGPQRHYEVQVTNLPVNVTAEEIKDYFGPCGKIADVNLVKKTDEKTKDTAYIKFNDVEALDNALDINEIKWKDVFLSIKRSNAKGSNGPNGPNKPNPNQNRDPNEKKILEERAARKIYVGNLSYYCTDREIKEYFDHCGEIQEIKIGLDKDGNPQGFAHLEFKTDEATEKALQAAGSMFMGRELRVYKAMSKVPEKKDNKNTSKRDKFRKKKH